MSSYRRIKNSSKELKKIKKLYNSLESNEIKIKQFYNLFYCYRRDIPKDSRIKLDRINDPIHSQYFLRYEDGSFTRMHTDNEYEVGETAITLYS